MSIPISTTAYNPAFRAALCNIESTEGTAVALTKADTIPVFKDTMMIDLGMEFATVELEDATGTPYQAPLKSAKCKWAFETPVYGRGVATTPDRVNTTDITTRVLQTCCDIVQTSSALAITPTINTPRFTAAGGSAVAQIPSFSLAGIFGAKGLPAGTTSSNEKLRGRIQGCKVGKLTLVLNAGELVRLKFEGLGVYQADFDDAAIDLSGDNWDSTAADFIMTNGASMSIGGQVVHSTKSEIAVDFGGAHVMSDAEALAVAGVTQNKRTVSVGIDPLWLPTSSFDPYARARAGGGFAIINSVAMYPQSRGVAAGYGLSVSCPFVQLTPSAPKAGGEVVRYALTGSSNKVNPSDTPFTFSIV